MKKEVDRKASKNRKIRYIVHDKILNFLTPIENLTLFEGRNAIVSNLFGVGAKPILDSKQRVTGDVRLIWDLIKMETLKHTWNDITPID